MKDSKGIFCVLIAAILFSIGGLCIKVVPWSPLAINGARNLISAIIIGIYLKVTNHKIVVNLAVVFGAVCMMGTTTLFTIANKLTTAANTIVLQFTAPIFVIFFMWMFFKEKPKRVDIVASAMVFAGIPNVAIFSSHSKSWLLFTPLPVTIDFCMKICFAKQKSTPESHSCHINQQVIGVGVKSNSLSDSLGGIVS